MTQKLKTKPEISVECDFSRGTQRFILRWEGYDRAIYNALREMGGRYAKEPDAITGYVWCQPSDLPKCIQSLEAMDYKVHHNEDLDALAKVETKVPESFDVIQITNKSVILHFEYGPKFNQMVAAIKRIPLEDREFDSYAKDWKIKHTSLPTLIWGWKTIGLDVSRLEEIQKIV